MIVLMIIVVAAFSLIWIFPPIRVLYLVLLPFALLIAATVVHVIANLLLFLVLFVTVVIIEVAVAINLRVRREREREQKIAADEARRHADVTAQDQAKHVSTREQVAQPIRLRIPKDL